MRAHVPKLNCSATRSFVTLRFFLVAFVQRSGMRAIRAALAQYHIINNASVIEKLEGSRVSDKSADRDGRTGKNNGSTKPIEIALEISFKCAAILPVEPSVSNSVPLASQHFQRSTWYSVATVYHWLVTGRRVSNVE